MDVKFSPVIANATNFPEAVIRATPGFGLTDIFPLWQPDTLKQCTFTRNGRAAIGIAALQLMQQGRTNTVLLPAYHCPALVEPFLWSGYQVKFYPVKTDLTVDLTLFQSLLTPDVTHCLLVRFFGFKQNIEQLIALGSAANKVIIEDCAHALNDFITGLQQPDPRIAARITSINKMLPTIDGGLLYMHDQPTLQPQHCSWYEELKGIAFLLRISKLIRKVSRRKPDVLNVKASTCSERSVYKYFQPSDLTSASFRHTKQILRCSNLDVVKARRQANYLYLVHALTDTTAGRCLYPAVGDEAPYVLPFLLRNEQDFQRLRMQRIQVLRWEEIAASDCLVSESYRSRLVQLPCHHKLKPADLDYIINAIHNLGEN